MRATLLPILCVFLPLAAVAEEEKARQHWAWQPLREFTADAPNDIDGFVRARLAERGLEMSPRADRRTLIRRLSFDLHGLPPGPEAVRAFVDDPDPAAYDKLVDRLLASPQYGERSAQHWLDIAHYADTHGFERDRRRPHAWRYRDYVIEAFNTDKPYDRFLQEQIAGDVLWPDRPEAVIATGFLAAGPWDFVGQVETQSAELRAAARSLDLDDIATQVMTATQAMTINCARCHDHKLDPISQQEYFQLRAVFAGVKRTDRALPAKGAAELVAARDELRAELGKLEPGRSLADIVAGGDGTSSGKPGQGIDPRSGKAESRRMGFLGGVQPDRFSVSDNPFVDGVFVPRGGEGVEIQVSSDGLKIGGLPESDGKAWDIIRDGPVNSQHSPELGGIDFSKGGHRLLGLHANAGITFDLRPLRAALGGDGELRFTAGVGYFGKAEDRYSADARVYVDGELVAEFRGLKRADGLRPIDVPLPTDARFLTLVSTGGGNGISMDQIGFGDPVVRRSDSGPSPELRARIAELRARITTLDREIAARDGGKVFAVVGEPKVPEVRVLRRGAAGSEIGDPVAPGAPSLLAMLDPALGDHRSGEAERRAALARWITHPDNPLTARVIANRLWHWHFGRGLVDTPSDFGLGGGRPSHPGLLDWLALELRRGGWSLKALHREILLSETYRQRSNFTEVDPRHAVDGDNVLLWRQNPRRIEAEAVRDSVLAASGKLNPARGGPGFEDFEYREAYAPEYRYITADTPALWRRSIYRYRVRTTPDRFLTTLDCPDPANFTPVRLTTTTPLQSLALYNNDFMLRQARYFSERVEREAADVVVTQVRRAFEIAFARQPSTDEEKLAVEFARRQGLFALCRSLFNANEFVYVD